MRYSFFTLISLVVLALCSCSGGQKQTAVSADEDLPSLRYGQMERTETDSLEVLKLSQDYLELLKEGRIDDAMAMLYVWDGQQMQPLSGDRLQKLRSNAESFPVLKYDIDRLRLYTDSDNEVRYNYEYFEKPEGMENLNNQMRGALFPRRFEGKWYLTIPVDVVEPIL